MDIFMTWWATILSGHFWLTFALLALPLLLWTRRASRL